MAGINLVVGMPTQEKTNASVQGTYSKASAGEKESVQAPENTDATVQISEEARQKYMELELLKQDAERLREQREAGEKYAVDMAKIMEIFRRISRGDKVPPSDEKKLMEHSSELYQAAKSAAMLAQNEKRKEHKALFEEEDELDKLTKAAMTSGEGSTETKEWEGISFENVGAVVSE